MERHGVRRNIPQAIPRERFGSRILSAVRTPPKNSSSTCTPLLPLPTIHKDDAPRQVRPRRPPRRWSHRCSRGHPRLRRRGERRDQRAVRRRSAVRRPQEAPPPLEAPPSAPLLQAPPPALLQAPAPPSFHQAPSPPARRVRSCCAGGGGDGLNGR